MGGISVLTWQEIKAWQDLTGKFDSWLAMMVRTLSSQYVSEYYRAKDPTRPSPLQSQVDEQELRKTVRQQLHNFINKK